MTYDEWKAREPERIEAPEVERIDEDEYRDWQEWCLRLERQVEPHELLDPETFWRWRDQEA